MSAKLRIAIAFIALFFCLGTHMPYFPVWLQSRGYSAGSIGIVLGVITWMRVIANPLMGRLSDRLGSVKKPVVVLAVGAALSYGLFGATTALWQVVGVGVLLGFTFSPLIPLTDSVALRLGNTGAINYGQLRLFGSAAFIVASNVGGWILEHHSEDEVLQTLRYGTVLVVFAVLAMPRRGPRAEATKEAGRGEPSKSHVAFLVTTGLLHASHAMLYAFGTAHWRAIGIGDTTIGQLWSIGVLAEIGLFAVGGLAQRRLGSAGLLAIAAVAGLARWPLLSIATTAGSLFAIQLLHAGTFAALHLGAIAYVQERVDDRATATVTTLYSAASGVGTGLTILCVGSLYDLWAGGTYVLMALLSGAGLVGARIVARASEQLDASP